MKKTLIIILTLSCFKMIQAQTDNGLIYKEIDQYFQSYSLYDSRQFDINDDFISDFYFDTFLAGYYWGYGLYTADKWECCSYSLEEYPGVDNIIRNLETPLNDSLVVWGFQFSSERYTYEPDTASYKVGLRYRDGDNYYYGWVEAYIHYVLNTQYELRVSRTCFCTIPNHPLIWGQTSVNIGLNEGDDSAFATTFPNPTKRTFTVVGKNLQQVKVFNTLGQRVLTVRGEGETLSLDLNGQPAGIYFVNITDSEGRTCVKKVVKE